MRNHWFFTFKRLAFIIFSGNKSLLIHPFKQLKLNIC